MTEEPEIRRIVGEIRLRAALIEDNPDLDAARLEWVRQAAVLVTVLAIILADRRPGTVAVLALRGAMGGHLHAVIVAVLLARHMTG